MGHREALVLFTGAGRTFSQVLFTLVKGQFLSAIETYVLSRADFLSCTITLLFGQIETPKLSFTSKIFMSCVHTLR
jgi:hypothetical protein